MPPAQARAARQTGARSSARSCPGSPPRPSRPPVRRVPPPPRRRSPRPSPSRCRETARTPLHRRADKTAGAARSCVRPPGGPAAEPPFCQPLVPEPAGTPRFHLSRHSGPLAKPGPPQKESQPIPHAQTNSPLASYKCVHTKARSGRGRDPARSAGRVRGRAVVSPAQLWRHACQHPLRHPVKKAPSALSMRQWPSSFSSCS